jgi:hypothetical protein
MTMGNLSRNHGIAKLIFGSAMLLLWESPRSVAAQEAAAESNQPPQMTLAQLKAESQRNSLDLRQSLKGDLSQLVDQDLNEAQHYREVFQIRLRPQQAIQVDLTSDEFDAFLQAYDAAGNLIAENNDRGGDANSRLFLAALKKGQDRLFLVATARQPRKGDFQLLFRERAASKSAQAQPLSLDQSVSGKLEPTSPLNMEKQLIYNSYVFDGVAGDRIRLVATPKDAPVALELRHNDENPVRSFSNVPGRPTTISGELSGTGRYELIVTTSPGTTTEYTLDFTKLAETQGSQLVTLGTTNGEFGPKSPIVPGTDRPYALYRFNGKPGQSVRFSVAGNSDKVTRGPTGGFTVELGTNTPIGFASALQRMRSASAYSTVTFDKEWTVLVRVAGPPGSVSAYRLQIEEEKKIDAEPAALTAE